MADGKVILVGTAGLVIGFLSGFAAGMGFARSNAAATPVTAVPAGPAAPSAPAPTRPDPSPVERVEASVVCGSPTILPDRHESSREFYCNVSHIRGRVPARVCWLNVIECRNGTRVTSTVCQVVQPGARMSRSIETADMANLEQCDRSVATSTEQIVVTIP